MQYHHDGYVGRNPRIRNAEGTGLNRSAELPETVDVLIVGAGPAGIVQAAQLTEYPEVHTRIIEARPQRLAAGRADGLFPRSCETFQAFEFYDEIAHEAAHMREMSFWKPRTMKTGHGSAPPPRKKPSSAPTASCIHARWMCAR